MRLLMRIKQWWALKNLDDTRILKLSDCCWRESGHRGDSLVWDKKTQTHYKVSEAGEVIPMPHLSRILRKM